MTDIIKRSEVGVADDGSRASVPPPRGTRRLMWRPGAIVVLLVVVLVAAALTAVVAATSGSAQNAAQAVRTVTLVSKPYTPQAAPGTTDDYHCTLLNPHVTQNSAVVSSQFSPGSLEDHHAILSLVPPSLAATAQEVNTNTGGNGWTCFGAPSLPGASLAEFLGTSWLSVWAPGHGADALPKGTGIELPAGSLVIMQVHYNLLVGDKPVKNSFVLDTVPASTPLLPLHLATALAPPDLACPTGVTGPLCTRTASIADQARRFGPQSAEIANGIEAVCGHDPSSAPVGDTASCTWPVGRSGYIVRAQAHMHLLGRSFSMVLNPGTPQARTVLSVPNYNFDYQKAYNLATPIPVTAGDRLQVNCTYDPRLAQELPILRKAPPHFVTWGDGSSDEMCLGLMWTSPSVPNSHHAL
jgi:Copper type II ascorbate-dependent monooxygenase, C-terminal domain